MIENTGIREDVFWELQRLAKDCGLRQVLLFGSRAIRRKLDRTGRT